MRGTGSLHPTEGVELPPDTQVRFLLAGGTAQAVDYTTGASIMRLSGLTTANLPLHFFANLNSTGAVVSSAATTASTNINQAVLGERKFQIPGNSTGFSVIAQTSGYVVADFWTKA